MKLFLDRFVLGIPRLYLKQFPYAWIVFIAFWTWPPNLSWIFFLVVLVGLFMVQWHHAAWLSLLKEEHASAGGKFHVDQPPIPLVQAARNIPIMSAGAGAIAFYLNSQIGLTAWQVFVIITGFLLLYRNSLFFGAPTTYVLTDSGLGVYFAPGHLDFRIFVKYDEIDHVEKCGFQKDRGWDCFARTQAADGLLLLPKNPNGFTKRMEKLFIAPRDLEQFLRQLPSSLQP